jgi:FixJ family two-component response regulator
MKTKPPLISVVDDHESIRESLPHLLKEFGYAAPAFSSAEEFLGSEYLDQTDCLIVDVAMPGMTGPELQCQLMIRNRRIPIIFISAESDERLRPRLLELGAVECLLKPFSEAELLAALNAVFRPS